MTTTRSEARAAILDTALLAAVPLHIRELRHATPAQLTALAGDAAAVIAAAGDTLMYGSPRTPFGTSAKQHATHRKHAALVSPGVKDRTPDLWQARHDEYARWCRICLAGSAEYSAGEAFNHLARGLACLAYTPGGITWRGMHWCVHPHQRCPQDRPEGTGQ